MLIERLCKQTGLAASQIERYAETASKRYKTFPIDKRDGSQRLISQPSKEIKALQRWLIRVVFQIFPIHAVSTAYSKGSSIRGNAIRHIESNFTLRMDFKDFFPSFSSEGIEKFLKRMNQDMDIGLSERDISFATRVSTRYGALTVGAPSSPILTNAMMYTFDEKLATWAVERDVTCTRYADDIFLSARKPEALGEAGKIVAKLAKEHPYADLHINNEKTTFLSRRNRRSITGLIVTPSREISIGRGRKRKLKTMIYLYGRGELDAEARQYLQGMLAFVSDVEPTFRDALLRKFGSEALQVIEERASIA